MTDAALPVTSRAVERFAEAYFRSLGGNIEKDGRYWTVKLPENADTDLDLDDDVLEIVEAQEDADEDTIPIAPESSFVERMLDEAADRTPTGSISLTGKRVDIRLPTWITSGPVDVVKQAFTPYYDRRAAFVLFHVGIETVSQFQRDELCAVAIDLNDGEKRPKLVTTVLDLTEDQDSEFEAGSAIGESELMSGLDTARSVVESEVSDTVRETRERATRSAEVELDEYRQFVQQQYEELNDKIDGVTNRIEEVNETIGTTSEQEERVEALKRRKELQTEINDLRSERDDLAEEIEAGFPEKRRKIRERHSLTVRIRPVAVTSVSYERGDLDLTLQSGSSRATKSYGYAVGAGVIEDANCERCGKELSSGNPLALEGSLTVGAACCND